MEGTGNIVTGSTYS